MKKFRFFMILCLIFSALTLNAKGPKNKKANIAEVTFSVNLHCHACVEKINANLPYIKGIKDLDVNLDKHIIWVEFNKTKTDIETIAEELTDMGYAVKVLATKNVPGFEKDDCCKDHDKCDKDDDDCCDDDDDDDDDDDCCEKDDDED